MSKFVAQKTIQKLIEADIKIKGARVLVMGLTFKENVPDLRNSKVADVIKELKALGVDVCVTDPEASPEEAKNEYDIDLGQFGEVKDMDAVILAVGHDQYKVLSKDALKKLYNRSNKKPLLLDIKGIFDRSDIKSEFDYWRL